MEELKFFDLREKKPFMSNDYRIEVRESKTGTKRRFAVAKAPSGTESWRILGKPKGE